MVERVTVNACELLVWLYELPLSDVWPERREHVRRYQERARGALEVEALRPEPREVPVVLWATFRGDEFARRLVVDGYDAIGWLLEECTGAPS